MSPPLLSFCLPFFPIFPHLSCCFSHFPFCRPLLSSTTSPSVFVMALFFSMFFFVAPSFLGVGPPSCILATLPPTPSPHIMMGEGRGKGRGEEKRGERGEKGRGEEEKRGLPKHYRFYSANFPPI